MTVRRHLVFDLNEAGVELMRQNLRRRHPNASEAEIRRRLVAWLHERKSAPFGDADGVPAHRFD